MKYVIGGVIGALVVIFIGGAFVIWTLKRWFDGFE